MARKTTTVTITDGGRELRFKLTQMPATKQEKFGLRLLALLLHGGVANSVNVPDGKGVSQLSIADFDIDEVFKALGNVNVDEVEYLGNQLLECCAHMVGNQEVQCTADTIDGIIEEVKSLLILKKEAFVLNFGNFMNGGQSQATTDLPPNSQNIVFSKNM